MQKVIQDPKNSQTPIETLICRFLLFYRSSVHAKTGETPFKLLFNHQMRTRLDSLKPDINPILMQMKW